MENNGTDTEVETMTTIYPAPSHKSAKIFRTPERHFYAVCECGEKIDRPSSSRRMDAGSAWVADHVMTKLPG
jgi:hypothetical protein